jgi:hypothetical protein
VGLACVESMAVHWFRSSSVRVVQCVSSGVVQVGRWAASMPYGACQADAGVMVARVLRSTECISHSGLLLSCEKLSLLVCMISARALL